jgi:hypothetical protein
MTFDTKTVRLVGGASALTVAIQNVLPAAGSEFTLPAFNQTGIFNFYLPAFGGIAALFPGVIPQSRMAAAVSLLAVGAKRILIDQATMFNFANVAGGYIPLAAGAFLLIKK